jgi:hypothetical protein
MQALLKNLYYGKIPGGRAATASFVYIFNKLCRKSPGPFSIAVALDLLMFLLLLAMTTEIVLHGLELF